MNRAQKIYIAVLVVAGLGGALGAVFVHPAAGLVVPLVVLVGSALTTFGIWLYKDLG